MKTVNKAETLAVIDAKIEAERKRLKDEPKAYKVAHKAWRKSVLRQFQAGMREYDERVRFNTGSYVHNPDAQWRLLCNDNAPPREPSANTYPLSQLESARKRIEQTPEDKAGNVRLVDSDPLVRFRMIELPPPVVKPAKPSNVVPTTLLLAAGSESAS